MIPTGQLCVLGVGVAHVLFLGPEEFFARS